MNIGNVPSQSHHTQPSFAISESVPQSFYHPTPLTNYGFYYGLQGEHIGFYSALPIMPLNGTINGVDSLSRPQAQG